MRWVAICLLLAIGCTQAPPPTPVPATATAVATVLAPPVLPPVVVPSPEPTLRPTVVATAPPPPPPGPTPFPRYNEGQQICYAAWFPGEEIKTGCTLWGDPPPLWYLESMSELENRRLTR